MTPSATTSTCYLKPVKLSAIWHGFFGAIWHPARSVSELAGPVQFRDFDSETGIGAGERGIKAEVVIFRSRLHFGSEVVCSGSGVDCTGNHREPTRAFRVGTYY